VRSYNPDIVITDIRMPPTHSDEGIRAAKESERSSLTLPCSCSLSTSSCATQWNSCSTASRAPATCSKTASHVNEFRASVRRVAEGGSAIDPAVVAQLVGRHRDDDPLRELTPRQREVLELMAEGRSNHGIASKLVVTEHAVEKHIRSVFQKLRIDSGPDDHRRVLAVLTYLRSTTGT
jgi:DNA-binding NarL/FixJ family response regulator